MRRACEVIAIDGPGGSGKSTVSREVARRLGWAHLDTGAYYRAATLAVLRAGADPDDEGEVVRALTGRTLEQRGSRMWLDGSDVSEEIRTPQIDGAVSTVSALRAVRTRMVALQREWVRERGRAVVEGRDIGSVVFPDAMVKAFLTARHEVRARRRAGETGSPAEVVAEDLARRDRLDSAREQSPLIQAPDAVMIDTSDMTVDEVVEEILELHRRAVGD